MFKLWQLLTLIFLLSGLSRFSHVQTEENQQTIYGKTYVERQEFHIGVGGNFNRFLTFECCSCSVQVRGNENIYRWFQQSVWFFPFSRYLFALDFIKKNFISMGVEGYFKHFSLKFFFLNLIYSNRDGLALYLLLHTYWLLALILRVHWKLDLIKLLQINCFYLKLPNI